MKNFASLLVGALLFNSIASIAEDASGTLTDSRTSETVSVLRTQIPACEVFHKSDAFNIILKDKQGDVHTLNKFPLTQHGLDYLFKSVFNPNLYNARYLFVPPFILSITAANGGTLAPGGKSETAADLAWSIPLDLVIAAPILVYDAGEGIYDGIKDLVVAIKNGKAKRVENVLLTEGKAKKMNDKWFRRIVKNATGDGNDIEKECERDPGNCKNACENW